MQARSRFQFSIAVMLLAIAVVGIGLGVYRYLFPPPVYPIGVLGSSYNRYPFYALGESLELAITPEVTSAMPTWDRRQVNPPVSAGDALILGEETRRRWIKKKLLRESDYGSWNLGSLELVPVSDTQWYWLVKFANNLDGTGPPHEFYVAVLMDGTVIEPIKEPVVSGD